MNTRALSMICGTCLCVLASVAPHPAAAQPQTPPPPDQGQPGADPRPGDDRRPRESRPRRNADPRPGDREIEAPREGPRGGPREGPPRDGKMLREMIDRQLQENDRAKQRLEDARRRLDEGTPPEEVFRMLREARGGMIADRFVERWRNNERPEPPPPLFDHDQNAKPPGRGPEPLPKEEMDELMTFVREVRPEFSEKLERWRKDEPRAFRAIMGRLIPKAVDTFRSRNDDKELYELRKSELRETIFVVEKAHELRRHMFENKGVEPAADQKQDLRDRMAKAYDARIKVREYEAAQLTKRLESSNKQIQEAKDAREALLDRALDEVLKGGPGRPGRGGEESERRPFGDDDKRPAGARPSPDQRQEPRPEPRQEPR
ncbi:MAG TPA: hypothetical protein VF777_08425 [Phycisphaerales bacterium]